MKLRDLFGTREPRQLARIPQSEQPKQEQPKPLQRRKPGDFGVTWPKAPVQKVKDYRPILTIAELEAYLRRCEETGYCSFDWETAADERTRNAWHYVSNDLEQERARLEEAAAFYESGVWHTENVKKAVKECRDSIARIDSEFKAKRAEYRETPLDPWRGEICTVSLSAMPHEARVVPISHRAGRNFAPELSRGEARKLVLDTLDKLIFRNPKVLKIAENLGFESKYAAKYGKYILMPVADPQIMRARCMQVAFPGKLRDAKNPLTGWGLKPAAKKVFNVTMGDYSALLEKHNADFFDEIPADEGDGLLYSAEDADYGLQQYLFWLEVAKQIPNYVDWLHKIEMPFSRVIGLMEYHGMAWDTQLAEMRRQEATAAQEAAAEEIKRICFETCGVEVDPGKTGKTNAVKDVLLNIMKIPTAGKTDSGNVSFDEEALINIKFMLENNLYNLDEEKYLSVELPDDWETLYASYSPSMTDEQLAAATIRKRQPHPYKDAALALIEQMKKIQKYTTLLSSHVDGREKWLNPVSGRIHAQFTPWTETSRLNASKPNGQNVPRLENDDLKVRNMYVAPPGRILFFIDFAGFELRILAWKSGDEVLIDIFRTDGDMHRKTAAAIAGKPEEEVTKKERTDAKPANFQMAYGGTEHALQKTILTDYGQRKTLEECAKMVEGRNKAYPGVKRYTEDVVIQAREDGYSTTIYGYIRLLPGINSANKYERGSSERRAMNTPIQGSAADIMKLAQNEVYDEIGRGSAVWNDFDAEFSDEEDPHARFLRYENLGAQFPLSHDHTNMIAQIHDEIIFEMDDDPDLVERAYHWIKATMEKEPIPGFPVPIKAEASVGYRWGEKVDVETWLAERRAVR